MSQGFGCRPNPKQPSQQLSFLTSSHLASFLRYRVYLNFFLLLSILFSKEVQVFKFFYFMCDIFLKLYVKRVRNEKLVSSHLPSLNYLSLLSLSALSLLSALGCVNIYARSYPLALSSCDPAPARPTAKEWQI